MRRCRRVPMRPWAPCSIVRRDAAGRWRLSRSLSASASWIEFSKSDINVLGSLAEIATSEVKKAGKFTLPGLCVIMIKTRSVSQKGGLSGKAGKFTLPGLCVMKTRSVSQKGAGCAWCFWVGVIRPFVVACSVEVGHQHRRSYGRDTWAFKWRSHCQGLRRAQP